MEAEQRRHSHRETERQRQQERRERARKASERERHKKARGNDCYVFRSSATATAATARRGASGRIICTQAGTHQKCLSEGRRDGRQSPKLLWPLVHGWRGDEGRARWGGGEDLAAFSVLWSLQHALSLSCDTSFVRWTFVPLLSAAIARRVV